MYNREKRKRERENFDYRLNGFESLIKLIHRCVLKLLVDFRYFRCQSRQEEIV